MAVRGYKSVKKYTNGNFTDVTALDTCNNKVLLRTIEPLTCEYTGINDVKNMMELIQRDSYDSAVLISKQFTEKALEEMDRQKIQHISETYMPPFDIQELYLAVVNCANGQCQNKCGKALRAIHECTEKNAGGCKTKALVQTARHHFEEGTIGLLKNDLRLALSLTLKNNLQ